MSYYIPLIIALLFYLARIREFLIKRNTVKGPIVEKNSFRFLFAGGTIVVLGSIVEYLTFDRNPGWLLILIGCVFGLAAFVYRNWAIRTLGKFWSVHVEIRDNQPLIKSGPFKRIRHPVYTAAILEVLGAVILLQAYISAVLIPLLVLPAILYRINIEEKELVGKFGKDYLDYKKKTGALIPKLFQ